MSDSPQFTESALRTYSEALRRQLYDAVVLHLWTPLAPGDYVPDFSPDQCGLTVAHSHGRWILLYIDLEEPVDAPPDQRAIMSRIVAAPESRFGVQLQEI